MKTAQPMANALLLLGAALITLGAWQAYPPAGPILTGALLISATMLHARGAER
jgi:hypothetical protein